MNRSIRLAFLAVLASFFATSSEAQSPPGSWLVSTGRTRTADGTWKPLVFTADARKNVLDAVEQELAQVEVTRKHAETGDTMWRWIAMCTWAGTPQRAELLETLALRNSAFLERFGRTREALFAVEGVLVPAELAPLKDLELAPATAEDLALQAQILSRPAMAAARERLRRLIEQPVADDEIRSIVLRAIEAHDRGQIQQLGKRAVPALRDVAADSATQWKSEADDPLFYLIDLDETAAAELILEQFDRGGPFWRRRAMRTMRTQAVLRDAGTWEADSEGAPRLVETWWPPVVLRLLRERDVAAESLELATDLARGDALDEALTAAILDLLRGGDREAVAAVETMLKFSAGRAGTQRILVAMLASRDAEQRAFAAEELVKYRDVPELRKGIASPDRALRVAAVQSLGLRQVYRRRVSMEGGFPPQTHRERFDPPAPTTDEIALLETGLRDADAGVRAESADILTARVFVIADATWDALAVDSDAGVRAIVARAALQAQPATAGRVLAVLAKDADPGVLTAVDKALLEGCEPPNVDAFLPAMRARRANSRAPFFQHADSRTALYDKLAKTTDGAALLGAWAEEGDAAARTHAIQFLRDRHNASQAETRGSRRVDRASIQIPYDDRRLAFLYATTGSWPGAAQSIAELVAILRIEDAAPWRALALDAQKPLWMRLHAFAAALEAPDAALVDELVRAITAGPESTRDQPSGGLRAVLVRLDAASARRVLGNVLGARPAPPLGGRLAEEYLDQGHALDSAAADAILATVLAESPAWRLTSVEVTALKQVASRPLAEQGSWFERAVRRRNLARDTVQILGELREPAYRPLLVECIDAGWMQEPDERHSVRVAAVIAIGRYLDDEAVEILLDAATRFSGSVLGQACYDALARIQTHRDQRAAWEQRKRAGATKDAAIAELVKILESGDAPQRAQAVRSLATLGAVEELPRVVRLLKDSDATVRAAAASALEVLNASTAKPR